MSSHNLKKQKNAQQMTTFITLVIEIYVTAAHF